MISIFIADDEILEIDYLSRLVLNNSDRFVLAGTCLNSLELMERLNVSKPDLLILDIRMPNMDGITLAEKIKTQWPEIMIILNSAYAEFEYAHKAIDIGIDAYLLKPSTEEDVINTILKCAEKNKHLLSHEDRDGAEDTGNTGSGSAHKSPTAIVRDYIDRHYREKISLRLLADYVHFNPSYLSKLFSQVEGISIHTYITQKRMDYAAMTLRNSDLPIKLIAQECGYETLSQFYRAFRSYFDCTPIDYRKGDFQK